MTGLGPLFDDKRPARDGTLPAGTVAALGDIACAGMRAWVESIILGAIERGRDPENIRELLSHERIAPDLVARLVIPLREGGNDAF